MNRHDSGFAAVCKGEQMMYGDWKGRDAPAKRIYVMTGDQKSGSLHVPHLILAVSYECNLNCAHCYNDRSLAGHLSMGEWKGIISQWADYVHREHGEYGGIVHFKGGEPMLFPGIEELLDFSSEKKLYIMITTNGIMLNERISEVLDRTNRAVKGNMKVIVSLDGSNEEVNSILRGRGAFDKTVRFIKELGRLGIAFDINFVAHSGNQHDIRQSLMLAKELGAAQFNVLPLVIKGGAERNGLRKADTETVMKALKEVYESVDGDAKSMLGGSLVDIMNKVESGGLRCLECVAGYKGLLYILPDGSTYSCPNTVLPDFHAGNIREVGIKGAVESEAFAGLRGACGGEVKKKDATSICINRNF